MDFKTVEIGVANYLHQEILQKTEGYTKFFLGTSMALFLKNFEKTTLSFLNSETAINLGIIDDKGDIKIEYLEPIMRESMVNTGGFNYEIPILKSKFTFGEEDVNKLFEHIRTAKEVIK